MNLMNSVEIFTIESKLESICPYYNDMNALFVGRQNFRPSFVLETNNDIVDESGDCDESFMYDNKTNGNAGVTEDSEPIIEHDPDDPDNDEYWADNDAHDPGRLAAQTTSPMADINVHGPVGSNDAPGKGPGTTSDHALPAKKDIVARIQRNAHSAASSLPSRHFPATEKRLTPRKYFSSIYMDVQSQVCSLECEKFEYK
ncbi:hypothetical protein H310_00844 [Aphanomyces invadans]|uniref:Uncharacterized protein n=1 Tax=Aphanomyces invadans TaxID=157072 RepID=A0A024UP10_9STRA|nr:hypothetical protein H310_00844 [Aphanomyces invadans]ETW08191.1 hypothetical protein H310_00844 [Aphanomyces invadans]|eukprot:XP_008861996.1 hypothetical protein H310_00844 [Aphanomyces invadans]